MVAHHVRDERGSIAVRRAVEGGADPDRALKRLLRPLELGIARIEPAPLVVVVRVIAEQLPVRVQLARDLGLRVDGLADLEERALHSCRIEYPHDRQRGGEVGAVVERECHFAVHRGAVRDAAAEPVHARSHRAHVRREHCDRDEQRNCSDAGKAAPGPGGKGGETDAGAEEHGEDHHGAHVGAEQQEPRGHERGDRSRGWPAPGSAREAGNQRSGRERGDDEKQVEPPADRVTRDRHGNEADAGRDRHDGAGRRSPCRRRFHAPRLRSPVSGPAPERAVRLSGKLL